MTGTQHGSIKGILLIVVAAFKVVTQQTLAN